MRHRLKSPSHWYSVVRRRNRWSRKYFIRPSSSVWDCIYELTFSWTTQNVDDWLDSPLLGNFTGGNFTSVFHRLKVKIRSSSEQRRKHMQYTPRHSYIRTLEWNCKALLQEESGLTENIKNKKHFISYAFSWSRIWVPIYAKSVLKGRK